jgi:hypothetical protein
MTSRGDFALTAVSTSETLCWPPTRAAWAFKSIQKAAASRSAVSGAWDSGLSDFKPPWQRPPRRRQSDTRHSLGSNCQRACIAKNR